MEKWSSFEEFQFKNEQRDNLSTRGYRLCRRKDDVTIAALRSWSRDQGDI